MPSLNNKKPTRRRRPNLKVARTARRATAEETDRQRLAIDRLLEVWAVQVVSDHNAHQKQQTARHS